jgi:hypothetical protein
MDALDGGTAGDAGELLASRYGLDPDRAAGDALAATRDLQRRGIVLAAAAKGSFPTEPGTSDLPDLEPTG